MPSLRWLVPITVFVTACFDPTKSTNDDTSGGDGTSGGTTDGSIETSASASASTTVASATDATTASTTEATSTAGTTTAADTTQGDSTGPAQPFCGDGNLDDGETCDDGDAIDGNGCNADCLPSGRLLWCVTDGDFDEDVGEGITTDNVGNILATGTLFREGADEDVWVGAWAPDGTEQFVQLYDLSGGGYERGVDIAYDGSNDAAYVLASGDGVRLLRISSNGTLSTNQALSVSGASSLEPQVLTVAPGGMYWAGSGFFMGTSRSVAARLSSFGGELWTTSVAQGPANFSLYVGAAADPLDDVYLAGVSGSQGFIHHRSASDGTDALDATGLTPLAGIAVAGNGDLVVVGTRFVNGQGDNLAVTRLAPDGTTVLWSVDWNGDANLDDFAAGVAVDADDRIVAVGTLRNSTTNWVGFAARLEDDGDTLWTTSFESAVGGISQVGDLALDSEGAPSVVGTQFGDAGDGDIFVCHLAI